MSRFNLKNYKKTDGDEHTSRMLSEQHSAAPNEITEKQLKDSHVDEKTSITEKQLDAVREEETPMTIEGRLNAAKSRFDIKHRNEDASKGNINKVEEKRIASDKVEDEKYESAASVPSSMRWWEKHKGEDTLKVASILEQMKKLAQIEPELERTDDDKAVATEVLTDDKERFKRLDNMWGAMDEGVADDADTGNEFVGKPTKEDFGGEDEDIELGASRELFLAEKRENMPSGINPYTFYASVGFDPTGWKNPDELQEAALDMILKLRPDLDGKISSDDLSKPKYFGDRGYLAFRLIGDEFAPTESVEGVEGGFQEISLETTDAEGTPVQVGKIKISGDPSQVDEETIAQDVADFVNDKHPELNISADSISIDVDAMEATFAIGVSSVPGEIDRMPQATEELDGVATEEDFPVEEEPVASEATPIEQRPTIASNKNVVKTSDTKKK